MYLRQPSVMIHLSQLKENCHNNPRQAAQTQNAEEQDSKRKRENERKRVNKEHLNQRHQHLTRYCFLWMCVVCVDIIVFWLCHSSFEYVF